MRKRKFEDGEWSVWAGKWSLDCSHTSWGGPWQLLLPLVGCFQCCHYTQYYCYWWDATIAIVGRFLCCHTTSGAGAITHCTIATVTVGCYYCNRGMLPLLPYHLYCWHYIATDTVGCFQCCHYTSIAAITPSNIASVTAGCYNCYRGMLPLLLLLLLLF